MRAQCPALQSRCSHMRKIIRDILQEHIQTQAVEVAGEERVTLENEVSYFPLILSPHQGLTRLWVSSRASAAKVYLLSSRGTLL